MSWDNKVVWSEGMFLRTQHFQQADRHTEWQVRSALAAARAHPWGVTDLQINREMLAAGKFAISRAAGMFEDGTPFTLPDGADHPAPLDLADSVRNCTVYLGLPVRQP
ncbi:MAG: type VI secretion system baseplate subunit TssK, partial [Rhodocyclaceae bacterium]|nr:type VI secretion system baseplate subunit TssK [Rhodocyclaceae bacterium]